MIRRTVFSKRIALFKKNLRVAGLDAVLVTDTLNVTYLSGFQGHDSMLLITGDDDFFVTDSRYIEEAREKMAGFRVVLVERSTYDTISKITAKCRLKRIGFEAMNVPYGVATRFSGLLKTTKLVPCKDMVESQRAVKDPDEVAIIKGSVKLCRDVLDEILKILQPGLTEISIASRIERCLISRGARPSFDPIVACGSNSSRPHAIPTSTRIPRNGALMIDMGARLNGYCSDITRMVVFGRVKDRFRKIYDTVRAAQKKAIDAVKPGVRLADVDKAARGYIEDHGFGRYFGHSLGHGIGLSVHEKPTVSSFSEGVVTEGMVFTVEPAIYVPGFGGVRIEDMVLVTGRGCEILTKP